MTQSDRLFMKISTQRGKVVERLTEIPYLHHNKIKIRPPGKRATYGNTGYKMFQNFENLVYKKVKQFTKLFNLYVVSQCTDH